VQNVKQSVVIRLDKSEKKKRTYRRKSPSGGSGASQFQSQSLPPNVIYQSNQITPVPFTPEPVPKITDAVKPPRTIMEDVGVGTEGFVKILELPTKREQLAMMMNPVQTRMLPPKQEKSTPSFSMGPQIPESQMPNVTGNEPMMVSSKTPKIVNFEKNAQKMEMSQMGKEDTASLMLGLSQFNVKPSPKITQNLQSAPLPKVKEPMGVPTFNFAEYQPVEKPLSPRPPSIPKPAGESRPQRIPITPTPRVTGAAEWTLLTNQYNLMSNDPPKSVEEMRREVGSKKRLKELIKKRQREMTAK